MLLPAERAAVRERRRRHTAGFAPRRVGLEVRGLDPRRREPHAAVRACGQLVEQRRARVDGRAPALHLSGRGARVNERLADDPTQAGRFDAVAPTRRRGTATSASRGAVSSANRATAERHVDPDALRDTAFELGTSRRRRRGRDRPAATGPGDRVDDRPPTGASAEVRGQRTVDVTRPRTPRRA